MDRPTTIPSALDRKDHTLFEWAGASPCPGAGLERFADHSLVLLEDREMTDTSLPPADQSAGDLKTVVIDSVKDAANRVSAAIDEGRRPGEPLDILAKVTREAPLGALLASFLFGAALARRRHW
jgi:hypothetical protein